MRLISIVFINFLIVFGCYAADKEGEFSVDGAGSYPCSAYTKAWDEQSRDFYVFIGWLDGYVTGKINIKKIPLILLLGKPAKPWRV